MKSFNEFILEAGQLSGNINLRYGSTPGTATDKSVSSAVNRALANPGTSQSASATTGRTGLTGSGSISYAGASGSRPSISQQRPVSQQQAKLKPTPEKPITYKQYYGHDWKTNVQGGNQWVKRPTETSPGITKSQYVNTYTMLPSQWAKGKDWMSREGTLSSGANRNQQVVDKINYNIKQGSSTGLVNYWYPGAK